MRRLGIACMLLLLGSVHVNATTLKPLQAVNLVDQAELIFTGRAVDRQVTTSQDGSYPFTFITFEVDQVLKGAVDGDTLTLRFEGGELGDEFVLVHGMPEFDRDSRYLLFVADNGQAISPVVGWEQGQLEFLEHPSRRGEGVLIDRHGMAVEGVNQGRFLRSRVERRGRSVVRGGPAASGIRVIEEDGVTITDPLATDPAADVGRELMPASAVLRSLGRLIERRAAVKSFRAGATVPSLGLDDVPETFTLRPVAADNP